MFKVRIPRFGRSSTRQAVPAPIRRAAIETLEARQMLAFTANVNFQPSGAALPAGYLADVGAQYGVRSGGLTYGWNTDNTGGARDRNSAASLDQRYDTLNHLTNSGNWSMAVPNGTYVVRVVAGDASNFNSTFRINVEGTLTINQAATSSARWAEGVSTVEVTDGKLTINSASGAYNNKLCFVEIASDDAELPSPPPPPTGTVPAAPSSFLATATSSSQIALQWNDNSGNETGFKIERRTGTNGTWSQIATVGANVESYLDTGLASSTFYQYRVRAYNGTGDSSYSNIDSSTTKSGSSASLPSTTIDWDTVASSPIKRAEAIGGVVNGKLYVLGGLYLGTNGEILATTRCDVYNPSTNKWTRLKDMPEKLTHAQGVVVGTDIWFVGGYVGDHPGPGTNHVWKYSTTSDSWTAGPNLPQNRGAGGAALLGRNLHFFGGMDETRTQESGDHYVLNLDNIGAGWSQKASLLNPRNHTTGAVVNGVLYCIGGQHGQEEAQVALRDIERYDPVQNKWVFVTNLPTVRSHIQSSTFTYGNVLIIVGGETGSGQNMRQVTAWDPATNKFTELTRLPLARSTQVAGVLPDGRIIAATGNGPSPTSTTYIGKFI